MYWYSISYYEKQGFLPTFIAVWQDLPIHKPKDYNTEDAEKATAELSQRLRRGHRRQRGAARMPWHSSTSSNPASSS